VSGADRPGAGVVAAAAVPHAPQFFTLPATEDHHQVARVEAAMAALGDRLRACGPDVVIIVANDHLENHMLHTVPSFTVHCGSEARGKFAGRTFRWPVPSELARALVGDLQDQGFDPAFSLNASIGYEFGIPLTFLGVAPTTPVIPIYVNSYLPPQPSADRCYDFGRALARACRAIGVRAALVASGGLSHYPGTDRYGEPDVAHDRSLVASIEAGNLRALLAMDDAALDRTGNVEARSWLILAGALGDRVPEVVRLEPSWHHVYAVAGWVPGRPVSDEPLHYPPTDAGLLPLYEALYDLRMHRASCEAWLDDPEAYAARWPVDGPARAALVALDEGALRDLGVHPLLGFLARLETDIARRAATADGP